MPYNIINSRWNFNCQTLHWGSNLSTIMNKWDATERLQNVDSLYTWNWYQINKVIGDVKNSSEIIMQ